MKLIAQQPMQLAPPSRRLSHAQFYRRSRSTFRSRKMARLPETFEGKSRCLLSVTRCPSLNLPHLASDPSAMMILLTLSSTRSRSNCYNRRHWHQLPSIFHPRRCPPPYASVLTNAVGQSVVPDNRPLASTTFPVNKPVSQCRLSRETWLASRVCAA